MNPAGLTATARAVEMDSAARAVSRERERVRWPVMTALGVLFALLASSPAWSSVFEWQRALATGQPWRLFTGHFTHWSAEHLHWDLLIFAIFGALLEMRSRSAFRAIVFSSALGLGCVLPLLHPAMDAYRGLSGIDCALAAAVGAMHMKAGSRGERVIGGAILLFVGLKVVFELSHAGPFFVDAGGAGFVSLPAAHGLGALIGGLGITIGMTMRQKDRVRSERGS